MSLIHNERVKLTAVCLNTLATTTVAAGVIAPVVAVVFGLPTTVAISPIAFLLVIAAWFFARSRPTSVCTAHARETAGMTAFQLYALFGSPLLLLLWALALMWVTGLQDRQDERRRTPAE
jgi:hypothetical protein